MHSNRHPFIIKWWFTPKLPEVHITNALRFKDKEIINYTKSMLVTLMIHPIKRRLAKYYINFLQRFFGLKVIAVTGSCGKTTTKDMITSILSLKGKTVSSFKNIDPVYNIPSTILRCKFSTNYLILEMGVEYPGEMDYYLWLVKPDIGVITNINPTHTEFFGDVGGILREKSKLIFSLNKNDVAILNYKNKHLNKLKDVIANIVWFGDGTEVMSSLEKYSGDYKSNFRLIFDKDEKKRINIKLPVFGIQNIENALAASAVAKVLEIDLKTIKTGLENFKIDYHRMRIKKHKSGAIIIDDSYNNNPQAAKLAIKNLDFIKSKNKVVIFGDMLELGYWDKKYHQELGEFIGKRRIAKLICIGKSSKVTANYAINYMGSDNVYYYSNWQESLKKVKYFLGTGNCILIKGSRSIGLDGLVSRVFKMI